MKIAHVTATFPPHFTGTANVCYQNALGLAQRGHQVTVFTADDGVIQSGYADPAALTVKRLQPLVRLGNAPLLPGLLGVTGFDLVHLHYPFYFGGELIWLNALRRRQPYVVTYHQDVLFDSWLRGPAQWHHRLVGKRILGRARKVLVTSLDYAQASRVAPLLAAHPERVAELHNGVDATRFHPGIEGAGCRARYALAPNDRVVLFVGGLDTAHYFKGLGPLLEALSRLDAPRPHLLIVGEGNLRAKYEAQAQTLGLAERVRFCGRVSDALLPEYYAASDLLVLPSLTMGEAFGMVLLEAMACERPVIASNLPGVRSVIADGVDGMLVKPGDVSDLARAMATLLANPQRAAMGAHGRRKVINRYAWPILIPQLERIYAEVVGATEAIS
ncbi:MAG: glycosyltransferase family 4 protein [Anaerolineae bacterium]|nr:glycosyltransferase family 4 protein [Anaerolineae bacterium]